MSNPPLPPFIERSMRAQQLLPSHRPLRSFFETALARFQSASAQFDVVCTLHRRPDDPPRQDPCPIRPQRRLRSLLVLDSSFNPPTIAHLRMAISALQDSPDQQTSRLLLLLSVNNADKAAKPAAFEQRLAMMWAFARDVRHSLTSAQERPADSREDGPAIDIALTMRPYFHDKSAEIVASSFYSVPGEGDIEPEHVFLAGYDTLIRIFNPKYYKPPASPNGEPGNEKETPIQAALSPFFRRSRLRVTMRTDDEWGGKDDQMAYVDSLIHGRTLEKVGGRQEWASRVELVQGRHDGEEIVSSTLARRTATEKDWERLKQVVPPEVAKWIEGEALYEEEG